MFHHSIPSLQRPRASAGFTLVEMMVTMAIAAILMALAAPNLYDFVVRNRLRSIGSDFTSSVMRARSEAIGKNICTTMCMSSKADDASPVCTTSDQDWQVGWIVFLNPACNSALTGPPGEDAAEKALNLVIARPSAGAEYFLMNQGSTKKLLFDPRGNSNLSGSGQFDLVYQSSNNSLTNKYAFNICLDKMGRTRTISTSSDCK